MSGYSLGDYSSQLGLDEYNQALANSGSQFRLPEPTLGGSMLSAQEQAPSTQSAPTAPEAPSVGNVQPVQRTAQQKASLVGGILGSGGDGNKLGSVLKLVGSFYGGGVGNALNTAGTAVDAQKSGNTQQKAGAVGSLLGR